MTISIPGIWLPRKRIWTPPLQWAMDKMRKDSNGKACRDANGKAQEVTCCTCTTPDYGSLPTTISISGYSNTFFTPCTNCDASAATPWDGSFTFDSGTQRWVAPLSRSINGKVLLAAVSWNPDVGFVAPCWKLSIGCTGGPGSFPQIWGGGLDGGGPTGTYIRGHFNTGPLGPGCDTTPTVTIV
jgi:hypothetical protein